MGCLHGIRLLVDKEISFGVRYISEIGEHCLDLCEVLYHQVKGGLKIYWTKWL